MADEEGGQMVSDEAEVVTENDPSLPPEAQEAGWPSNNLDSDPPAQEIYGTTPFEPINEEQAE